MGNSVGVEVTVSVGAGELVATVSIGAGVVSSGVGVAVSAEHELSMKTEMNKTAAMTLTVW